MWIIILLCSLFLSGLSELGASENCQTHALPDSAFSDDILNGLFLSNFSASPSQIMKAHCREKDLSLEEMDKWIEEHTSLLGIVPFTKTHGVSFYLEKGDLINAFEKIMTFNGELLVNTKYQLKTDCKKVMCAMKEHFGEEEGSMIMYLYLRYGINASYLSSSNTMKMSSEEQRKFGLISYLNASRFSPMSKDHLRAVLRGAQSFPEGRLSFKNLRLNKGEMIDYRPWEVPDWAKNALAETHDGAITMIKLPTGPENLVGSEYIMFHEFSHALSRQMGNLALSKDWLALSGWEQRLIRGKDGRKELDFFSTKPHCLTSKYGSESPEEDFAESVCAYRYRPFTFKKSCPEKYEFLKKFVFGDIEYTSEESCRGKSTHPLLLKIKRAGHKLGL